MICQNPLTPAQMKQSQTNYLWFGVVNGASYMCLGETVIILFAVRLNVPNTLIAVLGSMVYFGFLLLPLGKWMTGRVGAAQSQSDFWFMRNMAALMVASAAPASIYLNHTCAVILLLTGAFFFYGFRAAGVVMGQPLLGEICEPERRGRIISLINMLFHGFGLVSLVTITLLLKYHSSIWVLFGIIIAGAAMGCVSSLLIRRICETGLIKESARLPIKAMLGKTYKNLYVRKQLTAGAICNLMLILTLPMSILTVKKGYGFSDMRALLFTMLQFVVMFGISFLQSHYADRLGAKKLLFIGYCSIFLICISWLLMPLKVHALWLCVPFFFCGIASISITNGITFYFLETIPKEMQVVASMLISVATGVLAGLAGMVSGSSMLKFAEKMTNYFKPFDQFHCFFMMTLLLSLLCFFFIVRLPERPSKQNTDKQE